jgi:SAM-dependent methyltransferase
MNRLEELLAKSHYQSFDFLGKEKRDSNSGKKFELSKLDTFDLTNKTMLDVGCNSGYFMFRLLEKNPKKFIGIDLGEKFIDCANELNKEIFKSDKVEFHFGDFFHWNFNIEFDLIICLSTFHYFYENQPVFFPVCHRLLNPKGLLLLEMEEYPVNDKPMVDKTPRQADKKSYNYPNNLMLQQYIKNKFIIKDRYISIKQEGSLYDRYIYKLERI